MKTASTQLFQSSGYPVTLAGLSNSETPRISKQPPQQSTLAVAKKIVAQIDRPENWDVTWFANYE